MKDNLGELLEKKKRLNKCFEYDYEKTFWKTWNIMKNSLIKNKYEMK